jgi:hypothetical protein
VSSIKGMFNSSTKDPTFSTTAPVGAKNVSGARVSEVLALVGQSFSSGGHEGGGMRVGWVLRNGVSVPAIEDSYSRGAGSLIYTYYTPDHPEWARMVEAVMVRRSKLTKEMLISTAAPSSSTPKPVSTQPVSTQSVSTQSVSITGKPWFWPAVATSGLLAFLYFRRK